MSWFTSDNMNTVQFILIMLRCTGERLYGDGVQRWRGGLPVPPAGHRAEADRRELQVSSWNKTSFFRSRSRLLHGIKLVFVRIRIQAVVQSRSTGFRPRFVMTNLKQICEKPSSTVYVVLNPYGTKNVQDLQHEIYLILQFLVDNFGLPGSRFGFPIKIRIRWPNAIRIQSVSGSETLNSIKHWPVMNSPYLERIRKSRVGNSILGSEKV